MFGLRFVKGAAVGLATLGLMIPQVAFSQDTPQPKAPVSKNAQSKAADVLITDGGTVTGRVCNHTGKVIEGAKVELKQDNKVLGTTMTNKDGVYSFKSVKGGTYQMSSGNTQGTFRVWPEKGAPPTAKGHALLVMGENGARGQFGSVDPTLLVLTAGIIASVIIGGVALNKIDKVSDQVSAIPVSP